MTPQEKADILLHEWQIKSRIGIPAHERLNDNKSERDLEETLRRIKELIGNRE